MRLRCLPLMLVASCVLAWAAVAESAAIMEAGKDHPAYKSSLYRPAPEPNDGAKQPIRLRPGPQLFIDDYLIGTTKDVKRRVNCPARDPKIANPIITGKEDLNYQPYVSVIRDPETKRYRIWYGGHRDQNMNRSCLATMESEDGIHWNRPCRLLDDPAPIQFGSSVLDEGPQYADPATRYKFAWWMHEGKSGGMWIAGSPDGLKFKLLSPHVVLHHNHDINNIFWDPLRKRYVATISVYLKGPTWKGERRATMQSTSHDLLHWEKPWFILTPDDRSDPPETQFYAMQRHLIRGDLWIGLVKVLHDNWKAKGTPKDAQGMGHTQLAWTRDGENWVRDQTPYFEPDPKPGAWDHAHAWMDFQLPVGDEVFIYYGGYKNGHKMNRFEERQIGLIRIPRDRYVSRDAGPQGGTLTTRPVILQGQKLTVNACVRGDMRVRLLDASGKPIPGFEASIQGDGVALPVEWEGSLSALGGKPVQIEFRMRDAQLYAFDLIE